MTASAATSHPSSSAKHTRDQRPRRSTASPGVVGEVSAETTAEVAFYGAEAVLRGTAAAATAMGDGATGTVLEPLGAAAAEAVGGAFATGGGVAGAAFETGGGFGGAVEVASESAWGTADALASAFSSAGELLGSVAEGAGELASGAAEAVGEAVGEVLGGLLS